MRDHFQQVREVFEQLIGRPPSEWDARLAEACGDDHSLRSDVRGLLRKARAHAAEQPMCASDSKPQEVDPNLGSTIRAFRLTRQLGRGGMGSVYLGERTDGFKQRVAIKLIRRGVDTDDVLQRFRLERQLLAQINHPNIARLIDGGEADDGRPFFAMEYVDDARPITEYCDQHKLSIRDRLKLFAAVCRAVHAAHQNTILHRDLKPGNILVDRSGTPKLVDFGIAKLLGHGADGLSQPSSAVAGFAPMTPEYASPEQFLGKPVTTAADVFSLGVVLYELLVGQRPQGPASRVDFDALRRAIVDTAVARPSQVWFGARRQTPSAMDAAPAIETMCEQRGATLRSLRRQLTSELDALVLFPLNKEPGRRYPSAEAFAEDIERFLAGERIVAQPSTVRYRVTAFVRRNRTLVGGLAATFLALTAGGITSFAYYVKAERNATAARLESDKWKSSGKLVASTFGHVRYGILPKEARFVDVLGVFENEAQQVEGSQPEVAAMSLQTLGDTYTMMDRLDEAKAAFRRAAALLEPIRGSQNPEVLLNLVRSATVDLQRKRFDDAKPVLERALGMLHSDPHVPPETLAEALIAMGQLQAFSGNRDEGERICREAIGLLDPANEEHRNELASAWIAIGPIRAESGNWTGARDAFQTALPLARDAFGEFGFYTLNVTGNLAYCHSYLRDTQAAEALCDDLIVRARSKYDKQPEKLIPLLNQVGASLITLDRRQLAVAEPVLRDALRMAIACFGDQHLQTANVKLNLAQCLQDRGQARPEAIPLFRSAILIMEKANGENDGYVLFGMHMLGRALYHANLSRFQRAEPMRWDELREAREVLEVLLDRVERLGVPPGVPTVAEVGYDLTLVYDTLDVDAPRAVELARLARDNVEDKSSWNVAMFSLRVVRALVRSGDITAAENEYAAIANLFEANLELPPVRNFAAITLAKLQVAQGRFSDAEFVLLDADAALRASSGDGACGELALIAHALVRLHEAWELAEPGEGHDSKASEWREQERFLRAQ